ncbi:MAG: hypothetical protein U0232_01905 [Thermomicrobiales bacterium]
MSDIEAAISAWSSTVGADRGDAIRLTGDWDLAEVAAGSLCACGGTLAWEGVRAAPVPG